MSSNEIDNLNETIAENQAIPKTPIMYRSRSRRGKGGRKKNERQKDRSGRTETITLSIRTCLFYDHIDEIGCFHQRHSISL